MVYTGLMDVTRACVFVGLCVLCGSSFADQATASGKRLAADNGSENKPLAAMREPEAEMASYWLDRIGGASRQLNYIGTFSYQTGWRSETSRIAHRYFNGEESERMEVLDGSPREVIRRGKELRCVLPAQRAVIIGQVGNRGSFPGRVPQSRTGLTDNYRIRLEGVERIAEHEVQKLVFEPRDELRFAHALWADRQSGLLLKSQVLDAGGNVIEQFSFIDVRIGGEVQDGMLAPRVEVDADWQTIDVRGDDETQIGNPWGLRQSLPGFVLTTMLRHRSGGTLQMVFSDGLAALSVFIEPAEAGVEARGAYPGGGAVNVFERIASGHRITVLGEVPALLVQRAAEAVEALK
ncbi:MAG: MucB/RseB C-terminal domain-containing protein [Azoarcus sp.]|jgi:sigma-E factor negative regulatory protein RseB|nr:MucB/RseB C-terminal domain-containing protein [Azoarcus sp.]